MNGTRVMIAWVSSLVKVCSEVDWQWDQAPPAGGDRTGVTRRSQTLGLGVELSAPELTTRSWYDPGEAIGVR